MTNRTRRSAWNIGAGLLFTAITLGVGVFSTPLLLHWLGRETYGAYRVISDWGSNLALLDLGLGGALLARLAMAAGQRDDNAIRSLLVSGTRLYVRITGLILTAGLIWVVALPQLVATQTISHRQLQIAGLISLVPFLIMPFSVFRWVIESQKYYLLTLLLTAQSLALTGMLILAAWAGLGLFGQVLATSGVLILFSLPFCWLLVRRYPGVLSERPAPDVTRGLWSLNWPTFIYNLTGRLGLYTDNLVIAWALGPAAVASFFLTQRLASIALGQLQSIGHSTWSGLVELHAQGEAEVFRARFLELTALVSSLSLCVLGPIAIFNHQFIVLWVGEANFAGPVVSLIACINVWFWAVFSLWGWPISGTGNIGRWVPFAVVFAAVNLMVSILGTLKFGLIGPLLGTLLAFVLVQSWAMTRVLGQVFGFSPASLWRAALMPFWWGAPLIAVLWWLSGWRASKGWLMVLSEMAAAFVLGMLVWWTVGLPARQRSMWWHRIKIATGLG